MQRGLWWFHGRRPSFKKVFAPLFSKSGCYQAAESCSTSTRLAAAKQ
jgi:hypothetical protein